MTTPARLSYGIIGVGVGVAQGSVFSTPAAARPASKLPRIVQNWSFNPGCTMTIAVMQTTMIRASMTAYSTAVGSLKKVTVTPVLA